VPSEALPIHVADRLSKGQVVKPNRRNTAEMNINVHGQRHWEGGDLFFFGKCNHASISLYLRRAFAPVAPVGQPSL
jgi:hypothetical protein